MRKEDDILFLIRTLNKQLFLDFNKRSEELGITAPQARILFFINENENVRQVDIEKRFNLSKSTVSGFIKRMERNQVIKRVHKGSSINLIPDEKGLRIIDSLKKNRYLVIERLLKGMDEKERQDFVNKVKQALKNFEETEEENTCGKTLS